MKVHEARIQPLNDRPARRGDYVLYWMQASQRAEHNDAMEYAAARANELALPLLCVFGLADDYPDANRRHYAFMLQGLAETAHVLARRGVKLVVRHMSPPDAALGLADDAALLVSDRGYTRHQRAWRRRVAREAPCRVVQVEGDVVVPVELASDKAEYSAATLRPKIHARLDKCLVLPTRVPLKRGSLDLNVTGWDVQDADATLERLKLARDAEPVAAFIGGTSQATRRLKEFIAGKLARYHKQSGDPACEVVSHQSPYLHFGQISPVYIALQVADDDAPQPAKDAYVEQLIVRRELNFNFLRYQRRYDSYRSLPAWARATLRQHRGDRRRPVYTFRQLERAETHDAYWNAAMREMLLTGYMHNYMRMYWGKKIIEWTRAPAWAYRVAVTLNNRYLLDGRDGNSWGNIAWLFGLYDRPWRQREVFGTVRYMNAAGLERKFDIDAYVRRVDSLE